MAEIEFLLMEPTEGTVTSGKHSRHKKTGRMVRVDEMEWRGFSLRLHRMPAVWAENPRRVAGYVEKMKGNGARLWTDRALDPFLGEYVQPFPSARLASFFLENQPFRQIMIFCRGRTAWETENFWQERFLESCYRELNGLYLLGDEAVDEDFLNRVYEDSGLLAVVTRQLPEADGRRCVFVDAVGCQMADLRKIPAGCLYLDLRSDREKQRYLAMKRTDISYISARNYLDIALKARYNAV